MGRRTFSNFDQPYPGLSVPQSLTERSGGFPLSIENEYRVGARIQDGHAYVPLRFVAESLGY